MSHPQRPIPFAKAGSSAGAPIAIDLRGDAGQKTATAGAGAGATIVWAMNLPLAWSATDLRIMADGVQTGQTGGEDELLAWMSVGDPNGR